MIDLSVAYLFTRTALAVASLIVATGFGAAMWQDYVINRNCRRKRNVGLIAGITITWAGSAMANIYFVQCVKGGMVELAGKPLILPLAGASLVLVGAIVHMHTIALNRKWGRSGLVLAGVLPLMVGCAVIYPIF